MIQFRLDEIISDPAVFFLLPIHLRFAAFWLRRRNVSN